MTVPPEAIAAAAQAYMNARASRAADGFRLALEAAAPLIAAAERDRLRTVINSRQWTREELADLLGEPS